MFYSSRAYCEICGLAKCCVEPFSPNLPWNICYCLCFNDYIILYPLNLLANRSVRQPQMGFNEIRCKSVNKLLIAPDGLSYYDKAQCLWANDSNQPENQ